MKKYLICILSLIFLPGCMLTSNEVAPNLSSAYKDYFDIGVAVTSRNVEDLQEKELIDEYSTFSAEYEMKWDQIENTKDNFNFTNMDIIAGIARLENKTMRGHTLIWRTNVPSFIYDLAYSNKSYQEKMDTTLEYVKDFYINVQLRYSDIINVWDVVNEVIEDTNDYLYRHDNIYFQMFDYNEDLFEEFIAKVFKMVKEETPDVKRYYNDYFLLTNSVKRNKVITFINNINKLGADVEGVGLQSHITTSITKEQVDNAIKDFKSINVDISFTELDISIYEDDFIAPTLPMSNIVLDDFQDKLSRAYNHVFSAARENKEMVDNITFWGIYDKESWLVGDFYNYRTDFPLLFDEFYNKKNAYYIVKDFAIYEVSL